jgi:hypothetical protein
MKKENKKMLQDLQRQDKARKYPNTPIEYLTVRNYSDKKANDLTRCIIDFLNYKGHQAERISSMGRMIDNRETYTDQIGRTRVIGSSTYIPPTSTNGTADISSIINGKSIKIEVKIGKDRQSQAQKDYQTSVERAGGVYFIAKDFDSFYEFYLTL